MAEKADGRKLFPIKNTTEEITKAITEDSAGGKAMKGAAPALPY